MRLAEEKEVNTTQLTSWFIYIKIHSSDITTVDLHNKHIPQYTALLSTEVPIYVPTWRSQWMPVEVNLVHCNWKRPTEKTKAEQELMSMTHIPEIGEP